MQDERTVVVHNTAELVELPTRRNFLKALALGGTVVLLPSVFAACSSPSDPYTLSSTTTAAQKISLANDAGILTFAYVLEQLDSSFYQQLVALGNFAQLFTTAEQELLTDLRNNEVLHREFLGRALGNSFPLLTFDFSSVAVNKTSLLQTALTLELNGLAAYDGMGYKLTNANNLLVAGKLSSVEARHASALADAIDLAGTPTGTAYADLSTQLAASFGANNTNALDVALSDPTVVIGNAQPFIKNTITAS
jgi:hypothetical protein